MNGPSSPAAVQKAGEILAAGRAAVAQMTCREFAEGAWTPTSPYTVDELEDRERKRRGLPPVNREEVVDE